MSSNATQDKKREIILVTGGAGYIGSHTVLELLKVDYDVVVVDNLINSARESLTRVEKLTNRTVLQFYELDVRNGPGLDRVFSEHKISAVIHFAGLKAVGESVQVPLRYYAANVAGTISLLEAMERNRCTRIVFSSSSCVYGDKNEAPFREDMPTMSCHPYGETKLTIENLLIDLTRSSAQHNWEISILRYFNPIGAHDSGEIGDDPMGVPNNLLPFIEQVAVGRRDVLTVFGDDYPTPDGTCVRDYLHVVDCALGHIVALRSLKPGAVVYNLGTNLGLSVKQIITAFERVNGIKINYVIGPKRAGDIPTSFADSTKAEKELGWKYAISSLVLIIANSNERYRATRTLDEMVGSAWRWRSKNPHGFKK